jgi:hypothetical protein
MDLTPCPTFTTAEKLILRGSERRDLFEEKFSSLSHNASLSAQEDGLRLGLGSLKELSDSDSISFRSKNRNSGTQSIANSLADASIAESITILASGSESQESIEMVGTTIPLPSQNKPSIKPGNTITGSRKKPKDTHFFEAKISFGNVPLPAPIPLSIFDEEVGEVRKFKANSFF